MLLRRCFRITKQTFASTHSMAVKAPLLPMSFTLWHVAQVAGEFCKVPSMYRSRRLSDKSVYRMSSRPCRKYMSTGLVILMQVSFKRQLVLIVRLSFLKALVNVGSILVI
jgi:hypothetical protein